MHLRFADHEAFHRAAAGSVGSAVIAGVALSAATPLAPIVGGIAGLGIGSALAYGKPIVRLAAAGAATIPLFAMAPVWSTFAIAGALIALGLAFGARGSRGVITAMLGVGVALVGMWCAVRIDTARETAGWSNLVRDAVSAGALGLVGIVAMLPRHVKLELDAVATAAKQLPTGLDAEVRQLCDRAIAIWNTSKDKLEEPNTTLVRDGVLKTLEVAARSADAKVTGPSDAELATRTADIDARIAAATDAEVKREYTAARAALDDQRRYREHIAKGRERTVARMHNHVAALEKFQLAATGLSATAARAGETAVKQLAELSEDVTASGEALAELATDTEVGKPLLATSPTATDAEPAKSDAAAN